MSFILDALKKSETERQQQGSAEFSSVPSSSDNSRPSRWLWMLAVLLLVNFAVLIGILFKPDAQPESAPAEATAAPQAAAAAPAGFEQRVAEAIDDRPIVNEATPHDLAAETTTPDAAPKPQPSSIVAPTIDQLRLDGSLQLPEMHLDIHVYSENSAERFVFINMDKYREGDRTDEGPVVKEIRADGVLLQHEGRSFLLPRE